MSSLNKVQLIGRLGRDPEARTFPGGDIVCNVTIATSEKWKDKNSGEQREDTQWHNVVFNGRLAEIASQYLQKGALVYVEGKLKTRKYTDQQGVEKYVTEIRADQMQMLGSRGEGGGQQQGGGAPQQRQQAPQQQRQAAPAQQQRAQGGFDQMDDDIPF